MNKAPGGQAGKPQATNRSTVRLLTAASILGLILLYFYALTPTRQGKTEAEALTPALSQGERETAGASGVAPLPLTPALSQAERETVNRAPIPASPRLTGPAGAGLKVRAGQLLGSDPDGDALSLGNFDARSALGGQVTMAQGWLFYSPSPGATGEDSFGYTVTDSHGASSAGIVSITVTSAGPPTVARAQALASEEAVKVRSDGIPGSTYAVEFAEDSAAQVWQALGTVVANAFGSIEYIDRPPAGAGQRVYRFRMPQ